MITNEARDNLKAIIDKFTGNVESDMKEFKMTLHDTRTIKRLLNATGPTKRFTKETKQQMIDAYVNGEKINDISKRFECNPNWLCKIITESGEDRRHAYWTVFEIKALEKLEAEGLTTKQIAERLDRNPSCVRMKLYWIKRKRNHEKKANSN